MSSFFIVPFGLLASAAARHEVVEQTVVSLPAASYQAERIRLHRDSEEFQYLRLRGIQYAEQPIGELRWQPPVPLRTSEGMLDATKWGADCVQDQSLYDTAVGIGFETAQSEACLFLNIWAPEPSSQVRNGSLPVLFWIHGGSFTAGGSTLYAGDEVMAFSPGAIYVTANYRLGALGFLGGEAVARSTRDGSSGNFGLQDTREALRWVRRNIAALGGDPGRITIFGESSGASLVATHMVAPKSFGFFSAAIMESGPFDNYTAQIEPEDGFQSLSSYAGCDREADADATLACLKQLPLLNSPGRPSLLSALVQSADDGYFSPAIDGVELMDTPEVLASLGRIAPVQAVMLGTNANEGRYMMPVDIPVPGAPWSTDAQLRQWLASQWPNDVDKIAELYPASQFDEPARYWKAAAQVYTDSQYTCPTRRSASWLLKSKRVNQDRIFVYSLTYEPSYEVAVGQFKFWRYFCKQWPLPCDAMKISFGVAHGAELDMVWGRASKFNATDAGVAHRIVRWWQQFADQFSPGSVDGVPWSAFGAGSGNETMLLRPHPVSASGSSEICDFWDRMHSVNYTFRGLEFRPLPEPQHIMI
ncbi:unnamed protein product [Polarella glacialis]|nr:unnamed protein product [Polarella glacialis]